MAEITSSISRKDIKNLPEGACIQKNVKAGVTSVYLPFYFRDENGKAKQERDYIGTVENGEFVPNWYYIHNHPTKHNRPPERWKDPIQRKKALEKVKAKEETTVNTQWHSLELEAQATEDITRQVGATVLCEQILEEDGLIEDVAKTLNYDLGATIDLVNLAIFMALTSKASYLAQSESEVCKFIGHGCPSSQRISERLQNIGSSLQLSTRFSKARMERMSKDGDLIAVDGTFLDCSSKKIAAAAIGKRKNGTFGQQINFTLVSNVSTGVPLGYRWYSGDTNDVRTLDDLKELWLDQGVPQKKVEFVWDRGYFDAKRMAELDQAGFKFIAGAKTNLNMIKKIIDERNSDFYSATSQLDHHYCFGIADDVKLTSSTHANAYVFFSPNKQMVETRLLREELKKANKKWLEGKLEDNDPVLDLVNAPVHGQELEVNQFALEQECYIRGFFACVSNTKQSTDSILDKYRTRNEVEVLFRLMLGRLLRTTRVQSSQALEGLLLVVFVALSILSRIRKLLHTKLPANANPQAAQCDVLDFDKTFTLDDYVTISELLNELRGITITKSKSTGKARFSNLTQKKYKLISALGYDKLYDDPDYAWHKLSAKHMYDLIAKAQKSAQEQNG